MIKPRLKLIFLILLRETQFIVTILTALAILHLRTAHSIWFGIGTLHATLIAKLLKRFIRQPRPQESNKLTYGMPSTHSSSISFFGTYLLLSFLLLPLHPRLVPTISPFVSDQTIVILLLGQSTTPAARLFRYTGALFSLIASLTVCWSRVKLGHHTPHQVIVGSLVGTFIGLIWFSLWTGISSDERGNRNGLIEWGDRFERSIEDLSYLLLEAWQMRDGGLIWDGLGRPGLNGLSHVFGFGDWFESGDQVGMNAYLEPLAPHRHQT